MHYAMREDEHIWIIPKLDRDSTTIFYGLGFEDAVDRTLAKLILTELEDAKRHIKGAPSVNKIFQEKVLTILFSSNY